MDEEEEEEEEGEEEEEEGWMRRRKRRRRYRGRTTIRYHNTVTRMAKINKSNNILC